jgi:hypothetical protein
MLGSMNPLPREDRSTEDHKRQHRQKAPDFNPIENAFAKLKALLRKAAERTVGDLWTVIGRIRDLFTHPNAQTTLPPQDTMLPDRKWPRCRVQTASHERRSAGISH